MARVSDKAIKDCVDEIRDTCKRDITDSALQPLIDRLRPNFQKHLDVAGEDGEGVWRSHRKVMMNNSRFLGTFTEYLALGAPEITTTHLENALLLVKLKCTVGIVKPATVYCGDGGGQVTTALPDQLLKALLR